MGRFRAKVMLTLAVAAATFLVAAAATFGQRGIDFLPPQVKLTYASQPAPIPVAAEGRIPVSLRLASSIAMDDGSHPPAARELRFEFDRQFRLALGGVPTCPSGVRSQSRTGKDPCPEARIAFGRSRWEVAFPEREPIQVEGRTVAYKIDSRKLAFHVFLSAPVTADVVTTAELSRTPKGNLYDQVVTVSVPKVAGGYGSLADLRLRFRKGLFSLACPQRRFQSKLTSSFVDGTRVSVATLTTC
jgi:hypothetical protein